jgi:hypothetical protein
MSSVKLLTFALIGAGLCFAAPSVATAKGAAVDPTQIAAPKLGRAAKPTQSVKDIVGKGMTVSLNDDGSRYIRFSNWHQIWVRAQELNPGSAVSGTPTKTNFDIGIRRSRFLVLGQLSPRFKVLTHLGINNQTFNNTRKPAFFVHEAVGEFQVLPENRLYIGGGLHFVNGISRMSGTSTVSLMALDAPILNWPGIEASDQFARKLGVYLRGMVGRLDYRIALDRPFLPESGTLSAKPALDGDGNPIAGAVDAKVNVAAYNPKMNSFEVSGYFNWQFFDREFGALPYYAGTYIGEKKVLNIGAGFAYQPRAMASYSRAAAPATMGPGLPVGAFAADASSFRSHDFLALSGDFFADMPIGDQGKYGAFSTYAVFYHYDLGPNNVRNIGIMNVASADPNATSTSLNGPGAAYPSIGTGNHVYAQGGYVVPWSIGLQKFMPYVDMQFSYLKGLDAPSNTFGAGMNWFLLAHFAKVTLHYRNRPIFRDNMGKIGVDSRASEVILQGQVAF